ncbi:MAG: S41 family peptidase [Phycisphaerae bacterium]|nr:S41 family peptidase [Phycisphaerae bacterium]
MLGAYLSLLLVFLSSVGLASPGQTAAPSTAAPAPAAAAAPAPAPVDAARRRALVESAATAVREEYVFPDKGAAMADAIAAALARGDYDAIDDERALCERLTADMRAVTNDKHLRVRSLPKDAEARRQGAFGPTAEEARRDNWSFRRCEIVDGNVGILRFDAFVPTDEAKRVADAAMAFLGRCDALVIDLRWNGGGSPEMICYLSGYLFESPVLLNRMVARDGSVVGEAFSDETVNGTRFPKDLPVYVVTSERTFSGAEEFAYNLKNLGRATIVGETTGGGAHPVRPIRLDDRVIVAMPFMRAENPITKTNWEGKGVEPDVHVPADAALDRAIELARGSRGAG